MKNTKQCKCPTVNPKCACTSTTLAKRATFCVKCQMQQHTNASVK